MWNYQKIGEFFALRIAQKTLANDELDKATERLHEMKESLGLLVDNCKFNTKETSPSSLLKSNSRWIQVYNSRPDSGHWERGEGQFDSIDGRLMFTLDELDLLYGETNQRPILEFWLPQIVKNHPWVQEQYERQFKSKRFKNIMKVLDKYLTVKFADDLTKTDWEILTNNESLTLERLDWTPGIFNIEKIIKNKDLKKLTQSGLKNSPIEKLNDIEAFLSRKSIFFSSHRATRTNWEQEISRDSSTLPDGATLLIPRIPQELLDKISFKQSIKVIPAEKVNKIQLLALRQLHRNSTSKERENVWTG
jgi:hypothetical protein